MGLTTALNTSLNGLTLNETAIEVLGNNIANAGTNGFKASTVQFTTQLARTLSVGAAPAGTSGGSNPLQIGLGAANSAIYRDFTQGAITSSTSPSDLAIEGSGFFVLKGGAEGQSYSRNGNFALNSLSRLVNSEGYRVQGYGIDDEFNIVTTQLVDISIPLGKLNVAQQTTAVSIEGSLKTGDSAVVASKSGVIDSEILYDVATIDPMVMGSTAAAISNGDALLVDLRRADGSTVFTEGQPILFSPRKGGADYEKQSLPVTATTTLSDFMLFLDQSLGLVDETGVPADATYGAAGVSITGDGRLRVVSNMGTSQEVSISGARIQQGQSSGSGTVPVDLNFSEVQQGNGESAVVTFPIFDSLGEQIIVKMHAVLEGRVGNVTQFRYFLESTADSDQDIFLQTGIFNIGSDGSVTGDPDSTFTVNRANTSANDVDVEINFAAISGLAEAGTNSTLNLLAQDGAPPGTLSSFNIGNSGVISGIFSNGVIRSLGQIVLARFSNPLGLVESGGGNFLEGVASGPAQVVAPGEQGSGGLRAGAIELSNTDVGRSLVDLIVASTNYRGNARVISSVQQLVDELLVLGR